MIHCLYPDCKWEDPSERERAKRAVIDHINHAHDDAHVLIACRHELREVERFDAVTVLQSTNDFGKKGETIRQPQVRSECVRCGQFVVEDGE